MFAWHDHLQLGRAPGRGCCFLCMANPSDPSPASGKFSMRLVTCGSRSHGTNNGIPPWTNTGRAVDETRLTGRLIITHGTKHLIVIILMIKHYEPSSTRINVLYCYCPINQNHLTIVKFGRVMKQHESRWRTPPAGLQA